MSASDLGASWRSELGFDTKLRYPSLNLNIDEHGDLIQVIGRDGKKKAGPLTRQKKVVSLFWTEKVQILLWFIQMHGLIWLLSSKWPWPHEWLSWSRWTLLFILDWGTFFAGSSADDIDPIGGTPWSSFNTLVWTAILISLPVLLALVYLCIYRRAYRDSIEGGDDRQKHWISRLTLDKSFLIIGEALYIPLSLVFFRAFTCNSDGYLVEIDPSITCWSGSHIGIVIAVCVILLPFIICLPAIIFYLTWKVVVFHDAIMHERYMQSRELEYLMGVNTLYETTNFHVIASNRRAFAHSRAIICIQKLLLVAIMMLMNTYFIDSSYKQPQAIIFLVVHLVPCIARLRYSQYRSASSNFCRSSVEWTLVFNNLLSVLSAGEMRSAFLVATTLSRILLVANCIGLGCFVIFCVYALVSKEPWPTTEKDLLDVVQTSPQIINVLNNAKQLLQDAETAPAEFFPRKPISDAITEMRALLRETKRRRQATQHADGYDNDINAINSNAHSALSSSNEGIRARQRVMGMGMGMGRGAPNGQQRSNGVGNGGDNDVTRNSLADRLAKLREERKKERAMVLEWTLQDMTEDLALLHTSHSSQFASLAGDQEVKRYERMQDALSGLRETLARKSDDRILMKPEKKQLLQKLLVLRGLLGEQFVYGISRGRPAWLAETKLTMLAQGDDTASMANALPITGLVNGSNGSVGSIAGAGAGGARSSSALHAHNDYDDDDEVSHEGGTGGRRASTSISATPSHVANASNDFDGKRPIGSLGLVPPDGTNLSAAVAQRRLAGRSQPSAERSPLLRSSIASSPVPNNNNSANAGNGGNDEEDDELRPLQPFTGLRGSVIPH